MPRRAGHMTHDRNRSLDVGLLSRVEGEGGLHIVVEDGRVTDAALHIFEPPRFFEAFLSGRHYREIPDITARICGICPVAYQMSACQAVEDAFGATVPPAISALRRLLYCGEWLQSHALHVYFLHAPDFFGYDDAVQLAAVHPAVLHRGLSIKKAGNEVMTVIGGRAVHPVNVRVGGFYKAPTRTAIRALADPLRQALEASLATVEWVSGFDFPDVKAEYNFVALRSPDGYPLEQGRVVSSGGLDCSAAEFSEIAVEEQVERSTALHARLYGRLPYLTGPLARFALNHDLLTPLASEAAVRAGLTPLCDNPFRSIVVRSVEMVFACEEALRLVEHYEPPEPSCVPVAPQEGGPAVATGVGATEAPRGLLLHRYVIGPDGLVQQARIMPPTSQNQLSIEADLRRVAERYLELPTEELTRRAEVAVRNHDPCISCATHFLRLTVETKP